MPERRLHQRFQKQYTVVFYLKDNPQSVYDMPKLMDISRGGLKFLSSTDYPPGTGLGFKIRFPFLYPETTIIEGEVVAMDHVPGTKVFRIKVKFVNLTPPLESILQQMEEFNLRHQ